MSSGTQAGWNCPPPPISRLGEFSIQNRQSVYMQTSWKRAGNELQRVQPVPPPPEILVLQPESRGEGHFIIHVNRTALYRDEMSKIGRIRDALWLLIRFHTRRCEWINSSLFFQPGDPGT